MFISKMFENIGESLNPVFIKEMRQYFQNRRMIIFMGLLLLAQFICILFFSSAMGFDADGDEGVAFFLLIIFAGAILSVLICSVGAEQRFAEERSDKELNYAMLTTLRPSAIIWGKLEGAMVMILCIFALLLPFLTAAYFMRGLSAASLLITLCIFPVLVIFTLAGIFAGSFGMKWISVLYFISLLNSGLGLLVPAFRLAEELMESTALDSKFWITVLVEYQLALLGGILLFLLSLAVISPPKSNRMLPAKVYIFCLPALALLMMTPYYIIYGKSSSFPPEAFYGIEFTFCTFSATVLAIVALFEEPTNNIRVYTKCPRSFPGRCLHFLFSTGFSGSILLAFPILALPLALIPLGEITTRNGLHEVFGFLCIPLSFLCFALLSLVLRWRTRLPLPVWLWMIIFETAGNIAVWATASIAGDADALPLPVRVAFMLLSHIFCLVETIDNAKEVCLLAFLTVLAVAGVLLLFLFPVIIKAFRLHRFPEEAVKPPTKEMFGK